MINNLHILSYKLACITEKALCIKSVLDPEGIAPYESATVSAISDSLDPYENKLLKKIGKRLDGVDPEDAKAVERAIRLIESDITKHGIKVSPIAAADIYDNSDGLYKTVKRSLSRKFTLPYTFIDSDQVAIDRVNTMQTVFINDNYKNNVTAQASRIITDTIEKNKGAMSRRQIAAELKKQMNTVIRPVSYWEIVSAQVLNSSRSYSSMNFYDDAGITQYEVSAIVDQRTSEQCKFMDGTVLDVKKTLKRLEKYDDAESVDDVKDVQPWIKSKQIDDVNYLSVGGRPLDQDMSGEDLQALGLNAPPYHGNCRTTVVPLV